MSNELEVTLPLDVGSIRLPPVDLRIDDDDLYKEYIEIREGSGFVPNLDHGKQSYCLRYSLKDILKTECTSSDVMDTKEQ